MCLAPKARHSRDSPPQDGFAVANVGQRPRINRNPKTKRDSLPEVNLMQEILELRRKLSVSTFDERYAAH
jgi:hypothetical protein